MSPILKKTVSVFTAYRDGLEEGFDLDRDTLLRTHKIRAGSTRAYVELSEEEVGVVEGRLHRWWVEPGNPGGTKLHWVCPQCGQEQWGDWDPEVPNPCLWYSNCPCIGKWLIQWHGGSEHSCNDAE
jgi:hypothetical protein